MLIVPGTSAVQHKRVMPFQIVNHNYFFEVKSSPISIFAPNLIIKRIKVTAGFKILVLDGESHFFEIGHTFP